MTIDERLERLTERVESMAVTMELLQGMMRDLLERDARRDQEQRTRDEQIDRRFALLADLLEDHERRIDGLEGGAV